MVPFSDFAKLDFRVGEVKKAIVVEESERLITLQVDLGSDYGIVEILTGIRAWYAPADLIGKKFIFIANLEPRPMMGKISSGMMFAAVVDEKASLLPVSSDIPNGAVVR